MLCDPGILLSGNSSYVDLSRNYLSGTIPAAWLALPSKIEMLNLGSNQVTGTIPSMRKCVCRQALGLCCELPLHVSNIQHLQSVGGAWQCCFLEDLVDAWLCLPSALLCVRML